MSIKALQEYIRITKYARYLASKKRRETWGEQVDRVFDMHEKKYAHVLDKLQPYLDEARKAVRHKIVLGSQRALQFGGQALLDVNAKLYNCAFSHCNRARFFQETMYLLLCGAGVGFSVQKQHVAKLPDIKARGSETVTYQIPDSIEGWASAIGILMASYFVDGSEFSDEYSGKRVVFDFGLIRPRGSVIKSSGHLAPGPDGLRMALERIEVLLERVVSEGKTRLDTIDAYDVLMHASDASISGGIRRSATVCIFSKDDDKMLKAKTGNWFYENPQRGRSNNSVILLRETTTRDEWANIMHSVKEFGEPGFIWTDDLDTGFNPCVEIGLDCIDSNGNTGFAFCNLTEINGRKAISREAFLEACRVSAIIGTIQAGYTRFDYLLDPTVGYNVTEKIAKDEALLGCSITGIQDTPSILLDPEILREGAAILKKINEEVAAVIGINTAARLSTTKPAGTTSLLLGTSSGIHFHHANRYIRRVQANDTELTLKYFSLFNPAAVEDSVWSNNGVDKVISFLCEVPEGSRTKNKFGAIDLLEDVKTVQQNWVIPGTRTERSKLKNITHNVSNTCTVLDSEWPSVEEYIYNNRQWFAGISLLSASGDLDFPQAPLQAVHTPVEIAKKYGDGSLMASGVIVDALRVFSDNLWLAVDSVNGLGLDPSGLTDGQADWVRRAKKFADNYFNGDVRKMGCCLKEVHTWKQWCDLSRSYTDVPWGDLFEETHHAKNASDDAATACAGGKCEIV